MALKRISSHASQLSYGPSKHYNIHLPPSSTYGQLANKASSSLISSTQLYCHLLTSMTFASVSVLSHRVPLFYRLLFNRPCFPVLSSPFWGKECGLKQNTKPAWSVWNFLWKERSKICANVLIMRLEAFKMRTLPSEQRTGRRSLVSYSV